MPHTAPNPLNYFLGGGEVYTAPVDTGSWVALGNCPKFSVKATTELMQYMTVTDDGAAVVTESQVKTKSLEVSITADEFTLDSLALALGATSIGGGFLRVSTALIYRAVKLVGANAAGSPVVLQLPKVLFTLGDNIDFISVDTWASLPLVGTAMYYPKTPSGSDFTFMDAVFG